MEFGIKAVKKILSDNGMPLENLENAASEICGRHKADMDSIKEERDSYKQEAETIADLKNQLKEANDKVTAYEKDDYKSKYESEKAEHDKLKADIAGKETYKKKESAIEKELKNLKYSDEAVKLILAKGGYTDKVEIDKDGNATNFNAILPDIQSDFSMLTPQETITGTSQDNPLVNNTGSAFDRMTLGEKMKYANEHPKDSAVTAWINKK